MEYTPFVRKPFVVEAIEITAENLNDIAEMVGTIRTTVDDKVYIQVDRRLIPNVFRVYPGFWLTRMGDNVRCYSAKVFKEQFTEVTDEIKSWVDFINVDEEPSQDIQPV